MVRGDYYDTKGKLLKTLEVMESEQVSGIWSRTRIKLENHKTGHKTEFVFSEIDYLTPVDDDLFSKRAMERGAP